MLKRLRTLFFLSFIITVSASGQETDPGPGYQMTMINNPALSGSEGNGILRLSYLNFYPGNNFNLHSVYLSYDSYLPALHGGAGFYLTDDYLGGIINFIKGGISYSYFLKAGEDLFINAGLSASVFHRGFNFESAILPDQIDPMGGVSFPSSEALADKGQTLFDVAAGFLVTSGKITGGFSINHLAEPSFSSSGLSDERLRRKFSIHIAGDVDLNKNRDLKARPVSFMELQGGLMSAGAGVVFESNYLSFNTILLRDYGKNLNIQTGFSIKTGKVSLFYNYRFNIVTGNNLLPLSLLHQTGLAFSLNNVDKRNLIKTINFPKM